MLARRSTVLRSRRLAPLAMCAPFAAQSHNALRTRRGLTDTLAVKSSITSTAASASALSLQSRTYMGEALIGNLAVHSTQLGGCLQLSSLLYSPLGTAMLIVLAYNVVVICTKHVNYSMEITAKDYVQDQQLYVIMRYGILSCILLGMEVMFVEV